MCLKEDRMHLARIPASEGHKQKEIARRPGVSIRMVRNYLNPSYGTRPRIRLATAVSSSIGALISPVIALGFIS